MGHPVRRRMPLRPVNLSLQRSLRPGRKSNCALENAGRTVFESGFLKEPPPNSGATAPRRFWKWRKASIWRTNWNLLLYASIEAKNNIFVSLLEELEEDDLREAVRRESGADPAGADKVLLIGYLLEVNEDKQRAMSQAWASTPGAKLLDLSQLGAGAGGNSLEAWREKVSVDHDTTWHTFGIGDSFAASSCVLRPTFSPSLEKRRVEREHRLVEHSGQLPEINEIQEFVSQHMPRLNIRINLVARGSAFVYPSGYRRPCLAIK